MLWRQDPSSQSLDCSPDSSRRRCKLWLTRSQLSKLSHKKHCSRNNTKYTPKTVGTKAGSSELRNSVFNQILKVLRLNILFYPKLLIILHNFLSKLGRGVISSFWNGINIALHHFQFLSNRNFWFNQNLFHFLAVAHSLDFYELKYFIH